MLSWISFSIAPPFAEAAAKIWRVSEEGRIEAFVSVITPVNVFYVARKLRNVTTARQLVESLLSTCQVCAPDRAALLAALRLPGKDYEDAVQVVSAQSAALDALVTRDPGRLRRLVVRRLFASELSRGARPKPVRFCPLTAAGARARRRRAGDPPPSQSSQARCGSRLHAPVRPELESPSLHSLPARGDRRLGRRERGGPSRA